MVLDDCHLADRVAVGVAVVVAPGKGDKFRGFFPLGEDFHRMAGFWVWEGIFLFKRAERFQAGQHFGVGDADREESLGAQVARNPLRDLYPFGGGKGAVGVTWQKHEVERLVEVKVSHIALVEMQIGVPVWRKGRAEVSEHGGIRVQPGQVFAGGGKGEENAPGAASQFKDGIGILLRQGLPKGEVIGAEQVMSVVQERIERRIGEGGHSRGKKGMS